MATIKTFGGALLAFLGILLVPAASAFPETCVTYCMWPGPETNCPSFFPSVGVYRVSQPAAEPAIGVGGTYGFICVGVAVANHEVLVSADYGVFACEEPAAQHIC